MCGRYSLFAPPAEIERRFDATFASDFEPRYNAAPSQSLPVVTDDRPDTIQFLQWGLIPAWADDDTGGHVNARAETLTDRPSFRDAFQQRRHGDAETTPGRCLVLADGFYEWADANGHRQPYRVTLTDERPFAMAGLYERWRPPNAQTGLDAFTDDSATGDSDPSADPDLLETFTIVTTEANAVVGDLHDRMSVVLPAEREREWLTADAETARSLCVPYPDAEMQAYPVSTAVNDPSNDSPEIVRPLDG